MLVAALVASLLSPDVANAAAAVRRQSVPFRLEHDRGAAHRPAALRFEAYGRRFDLDLVRNETLVAPGVEAWMIDDAGRHTVPMPEAWIARGADGSEGRLMVDGARVRGWVRTPSETYVFEPDSSATTASLTVSPASDLIAASDPLLCGSEEILSLPGATASLRAQSGVATQPMVVEVALVVDADFYRTHGDQSVTDMLAIVNSVDGIYRGDLNLAIQVVQLVVYRSDTSEPFTTTTHPDELLTQLALARKTDPVLSVGNGALTHLMTGRNFGSAAGIAYVSGVCDSRYGAGLTTPDVTSDYIDSILVAHEMGHNLGALHDGQSGGGCESTPSGYIMWPVLNGSVTQHFSPCSIAAIDAEIAAAGCLVDQIPVGCGNGIVEPGEDCDAGPSALGTCCRIDCTWAASGLPCGDSGDICLDAVCDGSGGCANVPNTASCPSPDACEIAQCSTGSCLATGVDRSLESVGTNFHLDGGGSVVSAKIAASAPIDVAGSGPCEAGMEIVVSVGGTPYWNEVVDSSLWSCKPNGTASYRAASPMAGHVKAARVRYDLGSSRVTFKLKLSAPSLPFAPGAPTVFLLAGDHVDGQCGTNVLATCTLKGASYICN